MDITLTVGCCFCPAKHEAVVTLPDGWKRQYDGIDDENDAFCPNHALIAEFADAQCPGCVGGWGDCPLWKAFACREMQLSAADMTDIERGACPKRVNGTMSFSPSEGMQSMNLSDLASPESGKALAQAITEYVARYQNT